MRKIQIHEVGPRDGLQMEHETVPTETKIKWIKTLVNSGVDIVQIGSFVHPKYVPQMADTDELFRYFSRPENKPVKTVLSGLVLNERGYERGLACGVEMFCLGVSASETHSMKNTRMSSDEALGRILKIARQARTDGKMVQLSVQSAFGCGYEGPIAQERVLHIVQSYIDNGFTNISLADTAGHANPKQVREMFEATLLLSAELELTAHFHNTYAMAIANSYAAIEAGVHTLEASFGGLGGCPFTSVAGGNVCTEDLVHMLQRMGQRTDINLNKLISAAREAEAFFKRPLPGMVYKTGTIDQQIKTDA